MKTDEVVTAAAAGLSLGRDHQRRRRPYSSGSDYEHKTQPSSTRHFYAIIVNNDDDPSSETSAHHTYGKLVKLKRILIRPSCGNDHPQEQASNNIKDDDVLCLCIYEELSTQITVCHNDQEDYDATQKNCFHNYIEESCTMLGSSSESITPSMNEIQSSDYCCIDSIAFALSSWYYNGNSSTTTVEKKHHYVSVSRTDVEIVCNILLSSRQLLEEPEATIEHYCSCYDEECSADQILSTLGLTNSNATNARGGKGSVKQYKQSLSSSTKSTSPLRLIITGNPTSHHRTLFDNINSTQKMGLIKKLRRSIPSIPLISLFLQPVEGNDATEHHSSTILNDHLLRACVKRLLTGRVVLHSGNNDHSTIRSLLSVRVPTKKKPPSLSNSDDELLVTLQFRVLDIESRIKKSNDNNEERIYVILPSTRIIFQETPSTTTASNNAIQEEVFQTTEIIEPETPTTCQSKLQHQTISTTPHENLLLESLQILIQSCGQLHRPLIPRVFLFSGPPGVGKTFAVKNAISAANSWADNSSPKNSDTVCLVSIRGSELLAMSGGSNASTARELERHFEEAATKLCQSKIRDSSQEEDNSTKAVVVFLDECDALVSSHVVAAMLALLLDKMEGVVRPDTTKAGNNWGQIMVVGATNRVDVIPAFLRRPGRMEKEVVFSPPNAVERFYLLETLLCDHDIPCEELQNVAEECVGYVAADLSALVRKAAMVGIERKVNVNSFSCETASSDRSTITASDLSIAMIDTPASCLRDASLSAPPTTTWDDIAGDAGGAKTALRIAIEWPRTRKKAYSALGLSPPRGVLLHGPPGCAKTTLARAAAGSAGVSFLSLAPADVYSSSFVGDAEAVVRRAFDLARSAAPCVLFFDEIDAIIGGEVESGGSHGMDRGGSAEARVLSTFLNEMDGVDGSVADGVLVLAATNRPGTLDKALLRPGRFDKVIYVPSPDKAARRAILKMEVNKWYDSLTSFTKEQFPGQTIDIAIEQYFKIDALACDDVSGSMTGAEIKHACAETAVIVMRESLMNSDSLDNPAPALAQELLKSLMNGLEKALRDTKPLLESSLDEYIRFNQDH